MLFSEDIIFYIDSLHYIYHSDVLIHNKCSITYLLQCSRSIIVLTYYFIY